MNELSSMLMPLQTLSGWPAATDPTVLQTLGLLIGFPALAFVIVFAILAIAKIGTVAQANSGTAPVTEAVWVGGRGASDGSELEAGPTEKNPEGTEGGAGARW